MLSTTSHTPGVERTAEAADTAKAGRIDAIDFTKGALVVFMVVYHTLNYSAWRAVPGQYMAFLPPSFILITGFLLSSVYTEKYRADSRRLYRRLLIRGFKLVFIFTALNIAGNALFSHNYTGQRLGLADFFRAWPSVYAFGSARKSAFEILVPIGYLLLAAPLLLRAHFANPLFTFLIAVALFAACVWKEWIGFEWRVADMFTVGVIGMAAGQIAMKKWDALARRWLIVAGAYGVHWVGRMFFGQIYVMQVFAACASVLLIYAAAVRLDDKSSWVGQIIRLGQYSLFSYIVQIVVLQLLYRAPFYDRASPFEVLCLGAMTLALTCGAVAFVEWARCKSPHFETLYRTTFG